MNGLKRRRTVVGTATLAALVTVISLVGAGTASAAAVTVYQNEPSPLPGNVASLGYEATSTSEYGGAVSLQGGAVAAKSAKLRFGLSSWGCESGTWNGNDCSTTGGAKFPVTITATIYKVGPGDAPGSVVTRATKTMDIPYRPSANAKKCTGGNAGKWYSRKDTTCYNGKLVRRSISFGNAHLPSDVIVSLAYDTTHYGYNPIGTSAPCYTEDGGCGYDSLNVAVIGDSPTIGSQPNPDDGWLYSTWGGAYCDSGSGGTGIFRLDAGCWTGYQPMLRLKAS